mgnify:CR=1 FL=1
MNGIDLEIWDPSRDAALARRYSIDDAAAGKAACKEALQRECGLEVRGDRPLGGVVSRLDYQKGLDLALAALDLARRQRGPGRGLLHHTDRGSPYASQDYQSVLDVNGFVCSMSRRGNCYDNAVVESFFKTLKRELGGDFARHASSSCSRWRQDTAPMRRWPDFFAAWVTSPWPLI